ncbi:hypothetical protein ABNQ38_31840 [Azospirillum sp. A29]|uniref:hypothetical protein n=1 Tax=Azospirillum sp. A29 TaxID=3160606 RepID=UPI0036707C10
MAMMVAAIAASSGFWVISLTKERSCIRSIDRQRQVNACLDISVPLQSLTVGGDRVKPGRFRRLG